VLVDTARAARAARRGDAPLRLTRAGSAGGVPESRVPGAAPGPLTAALLSEQDRRLEAALASLPAEQRRVIRLRQMEGLPAAEVARRLGRTEGAIHAAYRRALSAWARAAGDG
jgi:RNA polymerase sigma-70 factor (ECF subfamily)